MLWESRLLLPVVSSKLSLLIRKVRSLRSQERNFQWLFHKSRIAVGLQQPFTSVCDLCQLQPWWWIWEGRALWSPQSSNGSHFSSRKSNLCLRNQMRFTESVTSGSGQEHRSRESSGRTLHLQGRGGTLDLKRAHELCLPSWSPTLTTCFLYPGTQLCSLHLGSQWSGLLGEPPTHQASVLGPQAPVLPWWVQLLSTWAELEHTWAGYPPGLEHNWVGHLPLCRQRWPAPGTALDIWDTSYIFDEQMKK